LNPDRIHRIGTESLARLSPQRLAGIMGNPDLYAYKNKSEDFDYSSFMLHPWAIKEVLRPLVTSKPCLRILELGSGNGSNGRTLCRLIKSYSDAHLHLIHLDLFEDNLTEANERNHVFAKTHKDFSFECVQTDLRSPDNHKTIIKLLGQTIDITFSIKFFHNTPIKISRTNAKLLGTLIPDTGIFILQCYGSQSIKDELTYGLKRARGKGYPNSIFVDRFLARRFLKANGLKQIYKTINNGTGNREYDHFHQKRFDYFFEKQKIV